MRQRFADIGARILARCQGRLFRAFAGPTATIQRDHAGRDRRKLGRSDTRGDPAAALLETLDPEQNNTFRDNYLDVPFDLSKVLFICTANMLDTVPLPLLDRMELIPLQGYSEEEKVHIAFRYLIPRQVKENGITLEQIEFPDASVRWLVRHYTREAGVRKLEQVLGTVCRKQARRVVEGKTEKLVVTKEVLKEFLGGIQVRVETEVAERVKRPGVAVGLAWTPAGVATSCSLKRTR